ncbi:MAG: M15 family metallopeptidase [Bacteroidota bacterium]
MSNCELTPETTAKAVVPPVSTEPSTPKTATEPPITIDTSISLSYIMGQFEPTKHPQFVQVPPKYANGRKDRWLRKETYTAFLKMYEAAKKDGIELKILSATRNFATQKIIWEGKWTGKRLQEGKENLAKTTPDPVQRATKILKWSSMPGTSRHHWGTDIDLNAFTNAFFEKDEGLKIYEWLTQNAATYGFCQAYSPKGTERPYGYNEEKWHWSYLPIARPLTDQARLRLKDSAIRGFKGAATATEISVVEKYILGVNQACL